MTGVASPVGERIRLRRQALGMTQEEFAARVGVSPSAVLGWEKDRYFPKRHQGAIEHVLGISLAANGTQPQPPAEGTRERKVYDLLLAGIEDMTPAEALAIIEDDKQRRAKRRSA